MKIASRKKAVKEKKSNSPEQQFNQAWQRVNNQIKKNQQLKENATLFVNRVKEQIRSAEQNHATAVYGFCEHLLKFYLRKSLTHWQRDVLITWFTENYHELSSSPFADHLDKDALFTLMQETMESMHPGISEQIEAVNADSREETTHDNQETDQSYGYTEDLFGEFEEDEEDPDPFSFAEDLFEELFRDQQNQREQADKEQKNINKLIKTSSINQLFRKLIRKLHPDRELDEAIQKQKNQLVGQLVEARDKGDIATLFSMYSEHIGESPLQELGEDLEQATQILQRQFEQLRDDQEAILAELDPIGAMLYDRFHYKTTKASNRAVEQYIEDLKQESDWLIQFQTYVTSLAKLKPHLAQKYDRYVAENLHDRFEFL